MQRAVLLAEALFEYGKGENERVLELLGQTFDAIDYKIIRRQANSSVFNEVWITMLLNSGQATKAIQAIEKQLKKRGRDPFLWRLLKEKNDFVEKALAPAGECLCKCPSNQTSSIRNSLNTEQLLHPQVSSCGQSDLWSFQVPHRKTDEVILNGAYGVINDREDLLLNLPLFLLKEKIKGGEYRTCDGKHKNGFLGWEELNPQTPLLALGSTAGKIRILFFILARTHFKKSSSKNVTLASFIRVNGVSIHIHVAAKWVLDELTLPWTVTASCWRWTEPRASRGKTNQRPEMVNQKVKWIYWAKNSS
ncbi:hypothetical protein HAX54_048272 [Datura stramonium]|uniref:Uncharacterized protein n=1 Tax=Datura stramonium TaxID=4076 RepID=A0ABS8STH3_DATST|nr:hypothetical protein [Datura stramonium]